MTLQEYLEAMAATQGRQNRGQTNLTTAQRAEMEEIIRQQYGSYDPSRVMWTGVQGDNPMTQFGARPQDWDMTTGRTGIDGFNLDANNAATFGQYHDSDLGQYFRILGQYDDAGALQGIDYRQFTPEGGWINEGNNALMATLAALGGMAYAGAGAAAAEGAGTVGAQSAAAYGNLANPATSAMVNLPAIGPEAAAILAAGGSGTAAGQAILQNGLQGAAAAGATGAAGAGGAAGAAGAAGAVGSAAAGAAGNLGSTVGEWLSNPAVIGGGLSLVGGALGADAASDAAEMQQASANAAIEEVRRQYDQNRADQMPWLEAGQTSLADLMGQMGALQTPYTQADFQNDPGYQFELAEGQRALDAAARARGLYGSSGSLRELLRYSQGLASTRYQDAWNRDLTNRQNTYNMLAGVSGTGQVTAGNLGSMGQNTANTVGDLLTQTGNSQAAGRIGSTNAWTQAGSNALNAWQQQMLIDRLGTNVNRW